jgi:hypothetical protein
VDGFVAVHTGEEEMLGKKEKKLTEEKENGNSKKINILNRMVKKIKNMMQLM